MSVHGVSELVASVILARYGNISNLVRAYDKLPDQVARNEMLRYLPRTLDGLNSGTKQQETADGKKQKKARTIGKVVSASIAYFICGQDVPEKLPKPESKRRKSTSTAKQQKNVVEDLESDDSD